VDGRFDAALFDLDGLLVDSEPLWHEAEMKVFGVHGVPLTAERCRETKGRFVFEVAQHWYEQYPWEGPSPVEVADEVVTLMEKLLSSRVALTPGAGEALDFCESRGLRLGLASSSPHRLIRAALTRHGLQERFEVLRSAEDVGLGKPDPAVFLAAAEAMGVAADRCVVLEDAPAGLAAAKAAGMACIVVPEARQFPTLPPPGSGGVFEQADLLLGSLRELNAGAWDWLSSTPVRESPAWDTEHRTLRT
jgi:sugar-phosphatase